METDQQDDTVSQSSEDLLCLICRVPIKQCHLGIDACRACAVFYKRTLNLKRPLKCKEGENECIQKDPTTSCRKCRFARFSEVFDKACAGEVPEWMEGTTEDGKEDCEFKEEEGDVSNDSDEGVSSDVSTETPPYSFIDHNSFFTSEPSSSTETPLLQRMRKAYSMLCMTRKSGELATSKIRLKGIHEHLKEDEHHFSPATYSVVVPNSRILFSGLLDFARYCFDDFRDLPPASRHFIIAQSFLLINMIDMTYRAAHHFPHDDTSMPSYSTFTNSRMLEEFLSDCPFDIDKEEVIKELGRNMKKTSRLNKKQFMRVKPSSDEFMAILGLAIWNDETSNISESLGKLVDRNRVIIMNELHKLYTSQGIVNYAPRLGDLHCLILNTRNVVDLIDEDVQVYRMMNLFNEHLD